MTKQTLQEILEKDVKYRAGYNFMCNFHGNSKKQYKNYISSVLEEKFNSLTDNCDEDKIDLDMYEFL